MTQLMCVVLWLSSSALPSNRRGPTLERGNAASEFKLFSATRALMPECHLEVEIPKWEQHIYYILPSRFSNTDSSSLGAPNLLQGLRCDSPLWSVKHTASLRWTQTRSNKGHICRFVRFKSVLLHSPSILLSFLCLFPSDSAIFNCFSWQHPWVNSKRGYLELKDSLIRLSFMANLSETNVQISWVQHCMDAW